MAKTEKITANERLADLKATIDSWKRDPEAVAAYLRWSARFHQYSPFNRQLAFAQNQSITRLASFNAWRENGRMVRKGEKAIYIFAPISGKEIEKDGDGNDVERRWMSFRQVPVFDIAQTEVFDADLAGDPEMQPDPLGGDEAIASLAAACESVAAERGITIRRTVQDPAHFGSISGREMVVNTLHGNRIEALTIAHELGHHFDPALEASGYYAANRTECEWVAEAFAFALAAEHGVDSTMSAADYLSGYAGDAPFNAVVLRVGRALERFHESTGEAAAVEAARDLAAV